MTSPPNSRPALNPVLALAQRIAAGNAAGLSATTREEAGYCAQLCHEIVKLARGEEWRTADRALFNSQAARRPIRWAVDYLNASRQLGQARAPGAAPQPGDILYWSAEAAGCPQGHAAIMLTGGRILENTTARRGAPVSPGSAIRVTPLAACPKPTLVARP